METREPDPLIAAVFMTEVELIDPEASFDTEETASDPDCLEARPDEVFDADGTIAGTVSVA